MTLAPSTARSRGFCLMYMILVYAYVQVCVRYYSKMIHVKIKSIRLIVRDTARSRGPATATHGVHYASVRLALDLPVG